MGGGEVPHGLETQYRTVAAGDHGQTGGLGLAAGVDLVAEHGEVREVGADEDNAFGGAAGRQTGVLRQEAVPGMDGVDLMIPGDLYDAFYIEVSLDGALPFADTIRFVRFVAVQGQGIFLRIDGHCPDAQFRAGPENTDGNLAAVGHQDRSDFLQRFSSRFQLFRR